MDEVVGTVNFLDREGNPAGTLAVTHLGWQLLPVPIAAKVLQFGNPDGARMMEAGEIVPMFRVVDGQVEYFLGTQEEAIAKQEAPKPRLHPVNASVLKADGTWEH